MLSHAASHGNGVVHPTKAEAEAVYHRQLEHTALAA